MWKDFEKTKLPLKKMPNFRWVPDQFVEIYDSHQSLVYLKLNFGNSDFVIYYKYLGYIGLYALYGLQQNSE